MSQSVPVRGELPLTGFMRKKQIVPSIYPVSSATFWRAVKAGKFPSPVKLSERITAWRVDDVREWMESK